MVICQHKNCIKQVKRRVLLTLILRVKIAAHQGKKNIQKYTVFLRKKDINPIEILLRIRYSLIYGFM